jgi:hypothetical protein
MSTINQYRIYCNTESAWSTGYGTTSPTVCYNNNTHEVNPNSIQLLSSTEISMVTINENSSQTGGHFQTSNITINALANSTSSATFRLSCNSTALICKFCTSADHTGDVLNMVAGYDDTITGALTVSTVSATTWTSQNYTVNTSVI